MKTIFAATLLLLVCGVANAWADFDLGTGVLSKISEYSFRNWMKDNGKLYRTQSEYKFRYENFMENEKIVEQLNSQHNGTGYGLMLFSDKSESEMKTLFNLQKPQSQLNGVPESTQINQSDSEVQLPDELNWREQGAVTDVRDYNPNCKNAHYGHAAADMVETMYKIKGNQLTKLSAKQFIDCQRLGCESGDTSASLNNFSLNAVNLETEATYPFEEGAQQDACKYNQGKSVAVVNDVVKVSPTFDAIKQALQKGPVAGAINGSDSKFNKCKKCGIITCDSNKNPNLYVTFIGYAKDKNQKDYLIGKNNWGSNWGDDGFFEVYPDTCGILNDYLYQFNV